uniref:Uncharacterized protein n=1 Tax=Bartonella schoenbuchensis TaxID=165694 RepID=A0A024LSB2_9HYPH|nr:hypothetical protein BN1046_01560 [Bartonella schoenbuchensis]
MVNSLTMCKTSHKPYPLTNSILVFTIFPLRGLHSPNIAQNAHVLQNSYKLKKPPNTPTNLHILNSSHMLKSFSQPQFPTSSNPAYSSTRVSPPRAQILTFTLTPLAAILIPLTSFHPSYASNPHETSQTTQYIHKPSHMPKSSSQPQFPSQSQTLLPTSTLLPASISHELKSHLLFTRVSPSQPQISPSRLLPSRPFSSLSQAFTPHTLQTPMKPHKPPWYFKASMRSKSHPRS